MNIEENPVRPLERLFNSTHARVLDFLILNQRFDYSHSDISKLARVSPRSLDNILPLLIEEKLIIKTRKSGKAYMYMYNGNSEKGKALERYFKATLKENIESIKNPNNEKSNIIFQQRKIMENPLPTE